MRRGRSLTCVLAVAAAVAATGSAPVRAGEPKPAAVAPAPAALEAARLERALETLPAPLHPVSVARVIDMLAPDDVDGAAAVVDTLAARGGHAAVRGLRRFVTHGDAEVRARALDATASLRLRLSEGMAVVREARSDPYPEVVLAAHRATGAVGDASDVPALLDAMASEDRRVVVAARDALRALSGCRLPYRANVWRQWWKETQYHELPRLAKALDLVERGAAPGDAEDARVVLERNAWLDVAGVRARLETWFGSPDPGVRREAFRLAGKLRLGDLAEPLAHAMQFERERSVWDAGAASAKVLGVRIESERPPPPPEPVR